MHTEAAGPCGTQRPAPEGTGSLWCIMLGAAPARRACLLRRGRAGLSAACKEALDALLGRKAAAAIRMAAVCTAPTWVKNAAGSTIENGAATSAPGTAASRHLNASPAERRGTPGAPSPASPRLCHRCQRSAPNSPNPGRHPGRARQPLPKEDHRSHSRRGLLARATTPSDTPRHRRQTHSRTSNDRFMRYAPDTSAERSADQDLLGRAFGLGLPYRLCRSFHLGEKTGR